MKKYFRNCVFFKQVLITRPFGKVHLSRRKTRKTDMRIIFHRRYAANYDFTVDSIKIPALDLQPQINKDTPRFKDQL